MIHPAQLEVTSVRGGTRHHCSVCGVQSVGPMITFPVFCARLLRRHPPTDCGNEIKVRICRDCAVAMVERLS